uniref:CBS domain-containing protein CBSX5-like isoform X2 n=1 Tax=Cicer arietinum TaxID=3827 RepID=A0A3Q7XQP6_CICAR|nr:CBS domain-containing protein CBSX5-like isoform X2 [Cicer arietinum]
MAVRLSVSGHEVSDLCLGKPPLRSISITDTIADALNAIKKFGDSYISVWNCHHSINKKPQTLINNTKGDFNCKCIGRVCMVDIICFLCKTENLSSPSVALCSPVSVLLSDNNNSSLVRHIQPNASLVEAIDAMHEGVQNLVIAIPNEKRWKMREREFLESDGILHNDKLLYCWLTQEDVMRYLLNSIGIVPAMSTFSVGDLLAYIDCGGPADQDLVQLGKEETTLPSWPSFSSTSSEEDIWPSGKNGKFGGFSSKVVRRSEAIVCYPWSSLVAVMIQALAHRVSYVWVVQEDGTLVGIVTFQGMFKIFREHFKSMS